MQYAVAFVLVLVFVVVLAPVAAFRMAMCDWRGGGGFLAKDATVSRRLFCAGLGGCVVLRNTVQPAAGKLKPTVQPTIVVDRRAEGDLTADPEEEYSGEEAAPQWDPWLDAPVDGPFGPDKMDLDPVWPEVEVCRLEMEGDE